MEEIPNYRILQTRLQNVLWSQSSSTQKQLFMLQHEQINKEDK